MTNPMDINLGGDNAISNLSFIWSAILKDGSKIDQFNEDGSENKFQLVKDKFNELVYFNLKNNAGKMFSINLINGLIGYNRLEFPYIEAKEKKNNIRLIFFRRHRIEIGTQDLKEKKHTIEYHLGFQYLDNLGNNQKIILQIDNEGNWVLGD